MENNEKIMELVSMLEKELEQHNLSFDEYLLYKAIHSYETKNEEVLNSLVEKGLVKDGKIVNKDHIQSVDSTLHDYMHRLLKHDIGLWENDDFMDIISFMAIYRNGGRNF